MADKKKSKTSSSNKKGKAPKKQSKASREIKVDRGEMARWIIGFLAVFIILTFFLKDSGWFGPWIVGVLTGLFGPMYYVVPFLMLAVTLFWKRDRENNVAGTKYVLYALEFIFISLVVHVLVAGDNTYPEDYGFMDIMKDLYGKGKSFGSAGLVSGLVALAFTKTIGVIASLILAIVGIFICTVLLCGATPKDTVIAIYRYFRDGLARSRARDEAAEAEDYDDSEDDGGRAPTGPTVPQPIPDGSDASVLIAEDPYEGELPFDLDDDPLDEESGDGTSEEESSEIGSGDDGSDESDSDTLTELASDPFDGEEDEELCLDPIEDTPYVFPPISLLAPDENTASGPSRADIERTSRRLEEILASFNVKAKVINCTFGPTVTRYEVQPETGVRVKSISNLSDDIALHLAATAVRIENIPGKAAVGIEIPNRAVSTVRLRGLIENPTFRDNKSRLFCALGEDVAGNPVYLDIAKMPHLLVAGATGQGKSVCINSLIISLLYRNHPNDVKLILIDPKTVEFSDYKDIPHLLVPVINDPKNAAGTLNWACTEMENRYRLIQEVGARDLNGYNTAISDDPERKPLPQIVIFIDEFADLMMTAPDDVETSVCRLAQKARAAGMHLVIGTQRPSVDVITGLIKANIPSRIALTTTSQVDSRTILDMTGAEKLLGKGDMLYNPVGAMKPLRVQGAFVDGKGEVAAVTQFIKEAAHAQYDDAIMKQIEQEAKLCGMKGKRGAAAAETADDGDDKADPMLMDAIEVAIECGTVSTSLLQRRLSLGYARAARIIDKMERKGFIGEFDSATKKRSILITREQFAEMKLNGESSGGENA